MEPRDTLYQNRLADCHGWRKLLARQVCLLYRSLVFLMKVEYAASSAIAERPQGLRGCGAEREHYASSRRAECHTGGRKPAGQGVGGHARHQAFQSPTPTAGDD